MGCWGLLGLLLMAMTWIIPENSLRSAPVRQNFLCPDWQELGILIQVTAVQLLDKKPSTLIRKDELIVDPMIGYYTVPSFANWDRWP